MGYTISCSDCGERSEDCTCEPGAPWGVFYPAPSRSDKQEMKPDNKPSTDRPGPELLDLVSVLGFAASRRCFGCGEYTEWWLHVDNEGSEFEVWGDCACELSGVPFLAIVSTDNTVKKGDF